MLPKIPQSVSYDSLLDVLQERIIEGDVPEDNEYFAELLFGLCRRSDLTKKLEEKRTTPRGEESVVIDITPYLKQEKAKRSAQKD